MKRISWVAMLLVAGCGGAAKEQKPVAAKEPPAAEKLDCDEICSAASVRSAHVLPPVSPCGPGRGTLKGKVLQHDGQPVAKAFVAAQSSCGMFYGTSAADGSFNFADLPQGPYLVAARSEGVLTEATGTVDGDAPSLVELVFSDRKSDEQAEKCGCPALSP